MILRPGITGFFESGERGPLPEYPICDFKRLVHFLALPRDLKVAWITNADTTPNFHAAKLESRERCVFILGHANFPLVAFAAHLSDAEQQIHFVDDIEIANKITRSFPGVAIVGSTELNRSVTEDDLAQLTPAERKQVEYWKPPTIGQLIFHWWD